MTILESHTQFLQQCSSAGCACRTHSIGANGPRMFGLFAESSFGENFGGHLDETSKSVLLKQLQKAVALPSIQSLIMPIYEGSGVERQERDDHGFGDRDQPDSNDGRLPIGPTHSSSHTADACLTPPRAGSRGGCSSYMEGDSTCNCLATASRDVDNRLEIDELNMHSDPRAYYSLLDGVGNGEISTLMRAAWRFLEGNTDLIDWAYCWTTGSHSSSSPISDLVTSDTPRVLLIPSDLSTSASLGAMNGGLLSAIAAIIGVNVNISISDLLSAFTGAVVVYYGGKNVEVQTGLKRFWYAHWLMWEAGGKHRLCAVADLASIVAHELLHVHADTIADLNRHSCYSTYIFQHALAWALYNRYPAAVTSCPCNHLDSRGVFGIGSIDAQKSMSLRTVVNPHGVLGHRHGINCDDIPVASSGGTSPVDDDGFAGGVKYDIDVNVFGDLIVSGALGTYVDEGPSVDGEARCL